MEPASSSTTPASSRPKPALRGVRPAAASRCVNGRSRPDVVVTRPPPEPSAVTVAALSSRRIRTPSFSRAVARIADASGSSLGRTRAPRCTIVTEDPSLAKACASSQPTGPPPRMTSSRGRTSKSQRFSLVRTWTSPIPGTAGTAGSDPTAISTWRAEMVRPSTLTPPSGSTWARPSITLTPAASSASGESTGSMCVMAARTCCITRAKSTVTASTSTPYRKARRAAAAADPAARRAFDGTQPV